MMPSFPPSFPFPQPLPLPLFPSPSQNRGREGSSSPSPILAALSLAPPFPPARYTVPPQRRHREGGEAFSSFPFPSLCVSRVGREGEGLLIEAKRKERGRRGGSSPGSTLSHLRYFSGGIVEGGEEKPLSLEVALTTFPAAATAGRQQPSAPPSPLRRGASSSPFLSLRRSLPYFLLPPSHARLLHRHISSPRRGRQRAAAREKEGEARLLCQRLLPRSFSFSGYGGGT